MDEQRMKACESQESSCWKRFLRRFSAAVRDERGTLLVETAVGFLITMTMVLGIIEVSMMAFTYGALEDAAREGVRYAIIHGTDSSTCSGPSTGCGDSTGANVVSDVTSYVTGIAGSLNGMVVNVSYPDSASTPESRVQVTVSYTYQPIFFSIGTSHAMQVSSEGRILY